MPPSVLLIDNYDSFTWNLVQAFGALGANVIVHRNDAISVSDALALEPTHVIVSPGPGAPAQAGISKALIKACAGKIPVLGVCLGHQAIVEAFGGWVVRAPVPIHGKSSIITHDGRTIFADMPPELEVGRYHSLIAGIVPDELEVSASVDNLVMAVRHKRYAIDGVQFHPESILTPEGSRLLSNLLQVRP